MFILNKNFVFFMLLLDYIININKRHNYITRSEHTYYYYKINIKIIIEEFLQNIINVIYKKKVDLSLV